MCKKATHNLVFASHNPGKFDEMQALFKNAPIEISFLKALGAPDVAETGLSFHENALIKARAAAKHTGKPAFGDDSGLCINALNGDPGIYSARYLSKEASFNQKMAHVLSQLEGNEDRSAFFACVIAYVRHADDQWPRFYEGIWPGFIHDKIEGDHGFGYDPIFIDAKTNRCVGTMTSSEKILRSHRSQAVNKLLEDLVGPVS